MNCIKILTFILFIKINFHYIHDDNDDGGVDDAHDDDDDCGQVELG